MKVIILAAGYATRLYPLTKDRPKALLPIKGVPIIEYILERLKKVGKIEQILIVTNNKFFSLFTRWLEGYSAFTRIKLINDFTESEADRLGAMGDLAFVIDKEHLRDDILVIAGDNLFSFDLKKLISWGEEKSGLTIGIFDIKDLKEASRFGVVEVDSHSRVREFIEKPAVAGSSLIATGIYYLPKHSLPRIREYLDTENSQDALGSYISWLIRKEEVFGYRLKGIWYDIGNIEAYRKAQEGGL